MLTKLFYVVTSSDPILAQEQIGQCIEFEERVDIYESNECDDLDPEIIEWSHNHYQNRLDEIRRNDWL